MTEIRVKVKEMSCLGWAVTRRGQNRNTQIKVEFDNGVVKWYPIRKIQMVFDENKQVIKRDRQSPEYVSMWQRFKNYFGLNKSKLA